MSEEERPNFAEYETKRDLGGCGIGLGGLLLGMSAFFLFWSLIGGYGPEGWLAYYIGPGALLLGIPLTLIGRVAASKARDLKSRL